MELQTIWEWRLRVVQARNTSLEWRVAALEDRSTTSSARSDNRWDQVKWLAEWAPKLIGLLRVLYHTWPLILAGAAAAWTLVLPGLRWLFRLIYSGLGYLAGLPTG